MEVILDKAYEFKEFYDWTYTVADPRVENWFLMSGYSYTLMISAAYLLAVYVAPMIMANREPFKLKWAIIIYNFACVFLNLHICTELFYCSTMLGYSYSCQPVKYTYDEYEYRIAKALWWFYFSKFIEMIDTMFFILRKKNNQVSFLHVYHHATMFPIWYIGVKWVAGGQSFFGAMINSFIHVIMYTYYGVAALGPQFQKYLWWKRYLTRLQLLQFFVGMVFAVQHIYVECDYPMWMAYVGMVYGVTIIALFVNFYVQAYIIRPRSSQRKAAQLAKIQFCAGILHSMQSILFGCNFPVWMQWALVIYAFTILLFFLNFYFHAYINKERKKKTEAEANGKTSNGKTTNGHTISNGNKKNEHKKDK